MFRMHEIMNSFLSKVSGVSQIKYVTYDNYARDTRERGSKHPETESSSFGQVHKRDYENTHASRSLTAKKLLDVFDYLIPLHTSSHPSIIFCLFIWKTRKPPYFSPYFDGDCVLTIFKDISSFSNSASKVVLTWHLFKMIS